jgi:uncharacterized protein YbjQ (UPF0145 family)
MSYKHCPNCQKKVDSLLTSRIILSDSLITLINSFNFPNSEAYCDDCGLPLITKKKLEVEATKVALIAEIEGIISLIPIVTIQNPLKWEYKVLELISAQSISGTGFLSELSASWADFTGGQSAALADKVSSGEDICKNKLRFICALMGGNAIIGTDIDYSEVGGGKGMLMVCMAGTAINVALDNDDFVDKRNGLGLLNEKVKELNALPKLRP